jgi:PAS domain S-box-containing protein
MVPQPWQRELGVCNENGLMQKRYASINDQPIASRSASSAGTAPEARACTGTGVACFWCMETPVLNPTASHPLWQHQLGLLLESTGEGIFGIDLGGHCMFINRAGAQMLGWARRGAGPQHARADAPLARRRLALPDTDCPIFNAFRRGLPCRIDTEVFWRRDGSAFPVEYSSHPILDGAQVRGAVITFVDITERKRADAALQQAKRAGAARGRAHARVVAQALGQQRELAAYSDKVREEERTRIAREVHDELGSLLVALKMDVNWLDKRLRAAGARRRRGAGDARAHALQVPQHEPADRERGRQRRPHHHRPAPQHPRPPGPVGRARMAGARVRAVGRAGTRLGPAAARRRPPSCPSRRRWRCSASSRRC